MSGAHSNISVFVPHIGCPHRCSFCNQFSITGSIKAPTARDVDNAVAVALSSKHYNPAAGELAFFGGSFTAIEPSYQNELLSAAYEYVKNGSVSGIRLSTRPDAIDDDIILRLKRYGVTAVELGAQSMDDNVLKANNRGHSADDVIRASALIKNSGISLGLQMMTGLYTDSDDGALYTARRIISLKPDTVRIYPTIVLENTRLSALVKSGEYMPQSLESAVELTARLLVMFKNSGINVIRTGLHSIDENDYVAGPWHPAFRELCDSVIYRNMILEYPPSDYTVYVAPGELSKMIGQKRTNIEALKKLGYNCRVRTDAMLNQYEIRMCREQCC